MTRWPIHAVVWIMLQSYYHRLETAMQHRACPTCLSEDGVYPLSRIYIAAITHPLNRSEADRAVLRAVFSERGNQEEVCHHDLSPFQPPRGDEKDGPPFHPDVAAGIAAAAIVILVGNAYATSRVFWTGSVWAAGGLGLAYLACRRWLVGRYRSARQARGRQEWEYARDMARWRRRWFCAKDGTVFETADTENSENMVDWGSAAKA